MQVKGRRAGPESRLQPPQAHVLPHTVWSLRRKHAPRTPPQPEQKHAEDEITGRRMPPAECVCKDVGFPTPSAQDRRRQEQNRPPLCSSDGNRG